MKAILEGATAEPLFMHIHDVLHIIDVPIRQPLNVRFGRDEPPSRPSRFPVRRYRLRGVDTTPGRERAFYDYVGVQWR